MISPKPPIFSPGPAPQHIYSGFLAWHSPLLGNMIFAILRASPPIDGLLGHPLLHMQLETQLWGVLDSLYFCSCYSVADPFSSLGTFPSSFIGGPVFHSIDDCEHPLLYLPHMRQLCQGPFSKILLAYAIVSAFDGWLWDGSLGGAVSGWSLLLSQFQTLFLLFCSPF